MTYDIKARCSNCERFLKIKANASSEVVVTCPDRKCKADNTIKVVMLTDYMRIPHSHDATDYKKQIDEMTAKYESLDSELREAKQLSSKIDELQKYVDQLEGIIDGQ